ncbi:hypothetical protein [Geodermatophilus sp. SYSU D01176]
MGFKRKPATAPVTAADRRNAPPEDQLVDLLKELAVLLELLGLRRRTACPDIGVHGRVDYFAEVVNDDRPRLPIDPAPSALFIGAIGSGWCEFTDRPDAAHLGMPPVHIGTGRRFRLPDGVIRLRFGADPQYPGSALVVVRRATGDDGRAPWVLLATIPRVLALLLAPPQHPNVFAARDWPPVLATGDASAQEGR